MKATPYLAIFLMLVSASIAQQEYYADVTFDIKETGVVKISGITNHPQISERSTSELTSKKANYWSFNITLNETFSNFLYTINLPEGAVINYIKSSTPVRIGGEPTFVKSTGENSKIQVTIQYSIEQSQKPQLTILLSLAFLAIMTALVAYLMNIRKHSQEWYNRDALTERQKQIIQIIQKEKVPITQKQLEEVIGIPKASLSRNIESLSRKGIIRKETKGMTNILYINQKKPET